MTTLTISDCNYVPRWFSFDERSGPKIVFIWFPYSRFMALLLQYNTFPWQGTMLYPENKTLTLRIQKVKIILPQQYKCSDVVAQLYDKAVWISTALLLVFCWTFPEASWRHDIKGWKMITSNFSGSYQDLERVKKERKWEILLRCFFNV